jgi:predicted nucleotidyltransferase
MGAATEAYWASVLAEALGILRTRACPHLVIGSIATAVYLGMEWRPSQDIDLFIPKGEADGLLEAFRDQGYAVYRKEPDWLYKVARPNVTIDLIFVAADTVELDDDLLARAVAADFEGVPVLIPSREDLLIMKAITDTLERKGHWYECLELLQREGPMDWAYLERRALASNPERLLAFLLYARGAGVDVPGQTVKALAAEVPI